jgi:hypothetical protein
VLPSWASGSSDFPARIHSIVVTDPSNGAAWICSQARESGHRDRVSSPVGSRWVSQSLDA